MTQVTERRTLRRPAIRPTAAAVDEPRPQDAATAATAVRVLGALSLLAMGAVHLEEYFGVHYDVVPIIGPLFVLNFAGAVVLAALLLAPTGRHRLLGPLLALAGVGVAASSIVFLLISEHGKLFGFEEYGYRPAVIAALAAEAAAIVFLGSYLATFARRR